MVASTGGHLKQLHRWRLHLDEVQGPFSWITFDKQQSRSMLADEDVEYVKVIGSRDPRGALRSLPDAARIVRRQAPSAIVSTGSAVALPFMLAGRARGVRCLYIESAARSQGPSLTGRMVARIPGVELYTQYPGWADGQWRYRGSIFDDFMVAPSEPVEDRPLRVVVTLGTLKYGFERLIHRLLEILPADAEVLWQSGSTGVGGLGIEGCESMPEDELAAAMREADVVVSHAGVGSALTALEAGRLPVLVPRLVRFGEHVDDHQNQIATELESRGLAVNVTPDALDLETLLVAAASRVVTGSEVGC
ncbi:glycosyltransferase [Patulibacter minatonensis]|uniref:glycosyltransferase n=1 Tax=Patulibacter minatonensis TaxID=298163 RepID=UPI001B7F8D10|nr:glycosyltransferase [Patulibacter minatonensis]